MKNILYLNVPFRHNTILDSVGITNYNKIIYVLNSEIANVLLSKGLLYNISNRYNGVVFKNIFNHTGMKRFNDGNSFVYELSHIRFITQIGLNPYTTELYLFDKLNCERIVWL